MEHTSDKLVSNEINSERKNNNSEEEYPPLNICRIPKLASNREIKFMENMEKEINNFNDRTKDIKIRRESQKIVERRLVEMGRCSNINPEIFDDERKRIFTMDDEKLESILESTDGLNASIHDNIACAVDAIIYNGKEEGEYTPLLRERIHNWFKQLRQIGEKSIEGYALTSSFSKDSSLFVIKVPQSSKNDELIHEAVIGFYALNKLRHILPNYMYIYGYTKCSPPVIKNKEPVTWCSTSNPAVSYLITENIKDSISFGDFIMDKSITLNDFLAVFIQLINALNLAYKNYGYTHYDLHYGNVMIRKYNNIIAIPYFGTNEYTDIKGYIASKYVPYIIDYGFNTININNIGFGKIGLERYDITNTPFPMFDVYKIICFLAERFYTSPQATPISLNDNPILKIIDRLFLFFNEGPIINRIINRFNNELDYYNVNIKFKYVTHDDYIKWLETLSGIDLPIHRRIEPLISNGVFPAPIGINIDTCRFYNIVASEKGPETALEYCEVVASINNDKIMTSENKDKFLSWLNSHFNASDYFDTTFPIINKKIKKVNKLKDNIRIPDLSVTSDITSLKFIKMYQNQIYDLLNIKEITSEIISYTRSILCSLANQGKIAKYRTEIDKLSLISSELNRFIHKNRKLIKSNLIYSKRQNYEDKFVKNFWTNQHEKLYFAL